MKKGFYLAGQPRFLVFCIVLVVLLLLGCTTTGFTDYYEPWYEDGFFPESSYLKETEHPLILKTFDINLKFREISSNWFWCIGDSGFNGPAPDDSEITEALTMLCREQGAQIAIYSKEYTDTRNGVYSTPQTNYHYYTDVNGYRRSYTTTSYNTTSYSIQRYDFSAYLFIPIPEEYKILYIPGLSVGELSQQDRDQYKQNTGCLVNIVYKDSAAYFANLSHGDIIIEINGQPIYTANDFFEIKNSASIGDVWNLSIVRNGQIKKISLIFTL